MKGVKHWAQSFQSRRHHALLIALMFLFIVTPLIVRLRFGPIIINVIAATALLLAINVVNEHKRLFHAMVVLTICSILCSSLLLLVNTGAIVILTHLCFVALTTLFALSI